MHSLYSHVVKVAAVAAALVGSTAFGGIKVSAMNDDWNRVGADGRPRELHVEVAEGTSCLLPPGTDVTARAAGAHLLLTRF